MRKIVHGIGNYRIVFFALFVLVSFFCLCKEGAYAASETRFYLETDSNTVLPGDEVNLHVLLDSTLPTNAYEIELVYSVAELQFEGYDDSKSIVDVWQERPSSEVSSGTLRIGGGSIHSFSGEGGEIGIVRFRARANEGEAFVGFSKGSRIWCRWEGNSLK